MSELVTDAMVEAGAKARWDYGREDAGDMTEWEMRHPAFREGDTEAMRAALEAVAPLIAVKALRDAADEHCAAWTTGERAATTRRGGTSSSASAPATTSANWREGVR